MSNHPYTKYFKTYPWLKSSIYLASTGICIVEVSPTQLTANPKNWRIHSQRQRSTYKAFKNKYGWLGSVLFNLQTGKLLDGHMRVDEALKSKEPLLPVQVVDVTEAEENEILATLDSIGMLAQKNTQALDSLLKATYKSTAELRTAKTDGERKLAQLRTDLSDELKRPQAHLPALQQSKTRIRPSNAPVELETDQDSNLEAPEDTFLKESFSSRKSQGDLGSEGSEYASFSPRFNTEAFNTEIDPNVLFAGLTEMGIPELLVDRLATPDQAPTHTYHGKDTPPSPNTYLCYSQQWNGEVQVGTIGFYTEDFRFSVLYSDPEQFLNWLSECEQINPIQSLIAPDYSSYPGAWPLVVNLMSVYKSRWVARLWQEAGYSVIPSIQMLDDFVDAASSYSHTTKYVLQTIPIRCPVIALECRLHDNSQIPHLVNYINHIVDVVKPDCVILYAGEEKQKYIHGDLRILKYKKGKITTKTEYRFLPQITTVKKERKRKQL